MDNTAEWLDTTERWRLASLVQMLNGAGPCPLSGAKLATDARNAGQARSIEPAEHKALGQYRVGKPPESR
jgi:hypothetical protein